MSTEDKHGRAIRVPGAIDAQLKLQAGPVALTIRAAVLLGTSLPLVSLILSNNAISINGRFFGVFVLLVAVFAASAPTKDGIWWVYSYLYTLDYLLMPTAIIDGQPGRAKVKAVGDLVETQKFSSSKALAIPYLNNLGTVPKPTYDSSGILYLDPGGFRGVLAVTGPITSVGSKDYYAWSVNFFSWLYNLNCPAQFITLSKHLDEKEATDAFEQRVQGWPEKSLLYRNERELISELARSSLGLKLFVVLNPLSFAKEGMPSASKLSSIGETVDTSQIDAEELLHSALTTADGMGIGVYPPTESEMGSLLESTILGARSAQKTNETVLMNGHHHTIGTVTKMPPYINVGSLIDAIMRAPASGIMSVHLFPMEVRLAQKKIGRQAGARAHAAARAGVGDVGNQVALNENLEMQQALVTRDILPLNSAVTFSVFSASYAQSRDQYEKLAAILSGKGYEVNRARGPGMMPALALSPGGAPLYRSISMTTDAVALRLLPALGTPFARPSAPLMGVSMLTGTPVYMSLWDGDNHNMVICASSGSGKSVTLKTLLVRHGMEGDRLIVIDPESEYRPVVEALGGTYYEMGQDALNVLAAGVIYNPDRAAGEVLGVLSVLGGDTVDQIDGKPIRRLADEDRGWLQREVSEFFREYARQQSGLHVVREPLLEDLVLYLKEVSAPHFEASRHQAQFDKCIQITSRLDRYIQEPLSQIFNRPSTFGIQDKPVGIGIKTIANQYEADLTPVLAVVLTSIFAAIDPPPGSPLARVRTLIAVDEAHHLTSDPDAGRVLGELVRKARKRGSGVIMASQKVEDFLNKELGRTLANSAQTQIIMGVEEMVSADTVAGFKLNGEEAHWINPVKKGVGVLKRGGERTVLQVLPGETIMTLADTTPEEIKQARRHAS